MTGEHLSSNNQEAATQEDTGWESLADIDYTPNFGAYSTAIKLQQQRMWNSQPQQTPQPRPTQSPEQTAPQQSSPSRQPELQEQPASQEQISKTPSEISEQAPLTEEPENPPDTSLEKLSETEMVQLADSIKNTIDREFYFKSIDKVKDVSPDSILREFMRRDTSPSDYAHKQVLYLKQHEAEMRQYLNEQPKLKNFVDSIIDNTIKRRPNLTYERVLEVMSKRENPELASYVKRHEHELRQRFKKTENS